MSHTRNRFCKGAVQTDGPVLKNEESETTQAGAGVRREARRKPRLHQFSKISCCKWYYLI